MKGRKLLLVAAAAAAVIAGCTKHVPHDRGGDQGGSGRPGGEGQEGGGQEIVDDTFKAVLRSDWSIKYLGREDYEEDDGYISEVERFKVTGTAGTTYTVRTITVDEFLEWYDEGDYTSYIQDEETFSGDTFEGELDILFDRMRHGNWYAFVLGLTGEGRMTGEYAMLEFGIEEETALDDYLKWTGSWTIGNGEVNYRIQVSASENNLAYYIDGWETGASISSDGTVMDQEWFEAFYDKGDGNMYFVSQYIGAYEDDGLGNVEELFLGKIHYTGNQHEHGDYIIDTEGIDLACAVYGEDGDIAVEPCDVEVQFEEGDTYRTSFYLMQYLCYSIDYEQWFDYNSNVPPLPLVMRRTESGGSAPALRTAKSGRASLGTRRAATRASLSGRTSRTTRTKAFVPGSRRRKAHVVTY